MLKRMSLFIVALMLLGSLAHAASKSIEGTVKKIDKNSITVKIGSDEKTYTFQKGLKFTVNGKRPSELTVKPGDTVSIVAGKDNTAEKIDVRQPSPSHAGSSN